MRASKDFSSAKPSRRAPRGRDYLRAACDTYGAQSASRWLNACATTAWHDDGPCVQEIITHQQLAPPITLDAQAFPKSTIRLTTAVDQFINVPSDPMGRRCKKGNDR